MRQRRLAQRAAARQATRLLTFLALLGVLVILVAARADVESSPPERIPEPYVPAAYADALAEVQPPEADEPPADSSTPASSPEHSPYDGIAVSEEEMYMLACLIWHESRGEPYEGQVAVAEVVLNRCLSAGFSRYCLRGHIPALPGTGLPVFARAVSVLSAAGRNAVCRRARRAGRRRTHSPHEHRVFLDNTV